MALLYFFNNPNQRRSGNIQSPWNARERAICRITDNYCIFNWRTVFLKYSFVHQLTENYTTPTYWAAYNQEHPLTDIDMMTKCLKLNHYSKRSQQAVNGWRWRLEQCVVLSMWLVMVCLSVGWMNGLGVVRQCFGRCRADSTWLYIHTNSQLAGYCTTTTSGWPKPDIKSLERIPQLQSRFDWSSK